MPLSEVELTNQTSKNYAAWSTSHFTRLLLCFPVLLMLAAVWAKLLHFQTFSRGSLVLGFAVVPVFALTALELNNFTRHKLS